MQNSSIQTRDINLIGEQRSLIHTYQVNNPGTKSLTLNFEKINLPAGTIVEFSDPERKLVKMATLEGQRTYSTALNSKSIDIKIILPRLPEELENFSLFIKNVEPHGIIGESDNPVAYLEISPFDKETSINVNLGNCGKIVPFTTVKLEHFNNYSIAEIAATNLTTHVIFPLKLKLEAFCENGYTRINDERLSGKVTIKITSLYEAVPSPLISIRCWLALRVVEDGKDIGYYISRVQVHLYDPFVDPFDKASRFTLKLGGRILKASFPAFGDQYGFIAFYPGEGPQSLVESADGYSKVRTMVRYDNGEACIVNLRGKRSTPCGEHTMNSKKRCGENEYSLLTIEYHPKDNPDLKTDQPFEGGLPIVATVEENNNKNMLLAILPG